MDSRHLTTFLAIFDHGSVTRAAQALYLAQPALSQSLRALEAELGVALFVRTPKGMTPTPAGHALVGPARQVLTTATEIDRTMEGLRDLGRGRLTLVCPTALAANPTAELVARFRRAHPGIVVDVREPHAGETVATTLLLGHADLGVDLLPQEEPRLAHLTLGTREAVLALAPELPIPSGDVGPDDLADLPLVCGPASSTLRTDLESWFAAAGLEPTVAVETDLDDHLGRFVVAGAGSAFIPDHRADAAIRDGLRVLRPTPPLRHDFGLLWLAGGTSRAAAALVDQAAAEQVGGRTRVQRAASC